MIVVVGLLVVNYFRNLDTAEPFLNGDSTEQAETSSDSYTVAAGDSLWSISESVYGSGYNWVDIMEANEIANPNDIEEGQVLVIPNLDASPMDELLASATEIPSPTPEATPEAEESPTTEPVETAKPVETAEPAEAVAGETTISEPVRADVQPGGSYTVVRGDNLWEIAVSAYGDGFRWVEIAEANELVNPSVIHAGNVLTIPA